MAVEAADRAPIVQPGEPPAAARGDQEHAPRAVAPRKPHEPRVARRRRLAWVPAALHDRHLLDERHKDRRRMIAEQLLVVPDGRLFTPPVVDRAPGRHAGERRDFFDAPYGLRYACARSAMTGVCRYGSYRTSVKPNHRAADLAA